MQTLLADNLELLWERDPTLAGRVRAFLRSTPDETSPATGSEDPARIERWVAQQLAGGIDDAGNVLFGLGLHAFRLKAGMGERPLWVVDPSLACLVTWMRQAPLLPLLLRGRLLVGETPAAAVKALLRLRTLRLIRFPARSEADAAWFTELEAGLRARAAQVALVRTRNTPATLLLKAGDDSELGQLLRTLPSMPQVTVEAVLQCVRQSKRPWSRAERLLAAMDSCRI